MAMFWDMMDFCMKLLKAEWEVNQQEGGEEYKCNNHFIVILVTDMQHNPW